MTLPLLHPRPDLAVIIERLGEQGADDIRWAEGITPPCDAEGFAFEAIFVICNSGMRYTVARQIFDRVVTALRKNESASTAFGHKGKSSAIDRIWNNRALYFRMLRGSDDLVAFCGSLPYIGEITKYHLAKNFGAEVAKPDVHLQRLASVLGTTPQALCEELARSSGYRVATVDTLLWRACATGVLNSRTGSVGRMTLTDKIRPHADLLRQEANNGDHLALAVIGLYKLRRLHPDNERLCESSFDNWIRSYSSRSKHGRGKRAVSRDGT